MGNRDKIMQVMLELLKGLFLVLHFLKTVINV